ncbi:TIGR03857 family LLM class F420-dependent oxidoreductase [Halioxenophilus sp. WMMB6]|uniref:TIGR03857 family LLM class F420-dependent oxidoreductase n=1 Tax=Halioxenophilus sp. WMMB6 TaxID=3073815 RepID=UPI00295F25DF|nr:TIGR03857 family LLM class F420-dependent oxidoreductase [Halioxenophilus sp. WMMB6]
MNNNNTAAEPLHELGFYMLAGHSDSPVDSFAQVQRAEALGLGAGFISERFNNKDAPTLCGAAAAVSRRMGIATAATNHNTRHPMITATFAMTMHKLTCGRFSLGLGRGFDGLFKAMGLQPITNKQLVDAADMFRRLWRGETLLKHESSLGNYPMLQLLGKFDESIPISLVAMGEKTQELAGRCMDAVYLHTFFDDPAVEKAVAAVRRGAEQAGRDPTSVRIWSILATVGDHIPYEQRLKKTVARLASYLQGYGDMMVAVNNWDPAALERYRNAPLIKNFKGAIDAVATTQELEQIAELIPVEWLATAATGSPEQCAQAIQHQLDLGVDSVILHGAVPEELAPILPAYRAIRKPEMAALPANPGWRYL